MFCGFLSTEEVFRDLLKVYPFVNVKSSAPCTSLWKKVSWFGIAALIHARVVAMWNLSQQIRSRDQYTLGRGSEGGPGPTFSSTWDQTTLFSIAVHVPQLTKQRPADPTHMAPTCRWGLVLVLVLCARIASGENQPIRGLDTPQSPEPITDHDARPIRSLENRETLTTSSTHQGKVRGGGGEADQEPCSQR